MSSSHDTCPMSGELRESGQSEPFRVLVQGGSRGTLRVDESGGGGQGAELSKQAPA